jgi:hypothetical protein
MVEPDWRDRCEEIDAETVLIHGDTPADDLLLHLASIKFDLWEDDDGVAYWGDGSRVKESDLRDPELRTTFKLCGLHLLGILIPKEPQP